MSYQIRDFTATDTRHVRSLVGRDVIRSRRRADEQVYFHPIIIWGWFVSSLSVDTLAGYLPTWSEPFTYPKALLGFAISLVPIMILVEFLHRSTFERVLRKKLESGDLINVVSHYQDAGGVVKCLIIEKQLRGFIAVEKKEKEGVIRHLVVDLPEGQGRREIATELARLALDKMLVASEGDEKSGVENTVDKVVVLTDPFALEGDRFYKELTFAPLPDTQVARYGEIEKLGLLKMSGRWLGLTKGKWAAKRRSMAA